MNTSQIGSNYVQWKKRPEIVNCGPAFKGTQSQQQQKQQQLAAHSVTNNDISATTPSTTTSTKTPIILPDLTKRSQHLKAVPVAPPSPLVLHRDKRSSSVLLPNNTLKPQVEDFPLRKRSISYTGLSADFYD